MTNERLDRFMKLLKEIFELDKSDLDFGIYRVMNLRKAQIEEFLTQRLPQIVQETLAPFAQGSKEEICAQMKEIETNAAQFGMEVTSLPENNTMRQKYRALQKQLAEGADLAALETDVYSALYSFFNRYYEGGDFISKRRYKEGVYAIPYEGEEVKLYWANQDQYYIKTSENFKDYTFTFDGIAVHFRLVDATTEQNNNKESKDNKRTFMLFSEDEENYPGIKTFEYDAEAGEIIIRFVYDIPEEKKRKYMEENYDAIQKWILSLRAVELIRLLAPIPTGKGKETTNLLEKHLKGYVAKNTFDYFIHKDLQGFLTRELDFFIKNEVMHLDDLDTDSEARVETYLAKIKAIKRVGKIIIDFLAQIENFQKKLWLKKKFVIETNWCITLDKVNESFWKEIIDNKEQIEEWIIMYAIEEAEGWSNPPTSEFLRRNQNLIIDTKYFSNSFKYALLESIHDLDSQTNALLINGDNFHAINLLRENYANSVKTIFIDPPYNTEDDRANGRFCYKDGFADSSWITMMNDRCSNALELLTTNGLFFTTIGDDECYNLQLLLNTLLGKNNFKANFIWNSRKSKQNDIDVSLAHNYVLTYSVAKSKDELYGEPLNEDEFSNPDSDPNGKWKEAPLDAPGIRERTSFFAITNPNTGVAYFPPQGRHWTVFEEDVESLIESGRIYFGKNGKSKPKQKRYWVEVQNDAKTISTLWDDVDTATDATKELEGILGRKIFETPKPVSLMVKIIQQSVKGNEYILDFFAGSGTTGHAVMYMNRLDGKNRKYILVEMGEHFESVVKPRIKKVVYAPEWKNGKPQQRDSGMSQIIKYMRLENYEDALSNIEFSDNGGQLVALLGEEYLIRYMVDMESRGNLLDVEAFSNPFAYTMKITEKNECKERDIDLCETFNYLIGLRVISQSAISYFFSKPAENPSYEGAVDLVSDISGQYAFRQIEGTLPDCRRALVIWRTVTDDVIASNAALDAYFTTYRKNAQDRKYDVIFVNGDSNLENLRNSNEGWNVQVTEIEFKKRMFEEV